MSKLEIEIQGSGVTVVFIHGLGGTSNVFTPQVGVLSRFFRCLRPDLPGAGRSPAAGPVSIESLATSVLDLIDDSAHVVAHSMGTIVAQHLALRAPRKVKSLTLLGPIHSPSDAAREAMRARAATARTEGMRPIADTVVQGGTSAETKAHRPEIAAFVRELIMRQNAESYAFHCEALASATSANLAGIAQPVLLITGDEDGTSPPIAASEMARQLPRSQLRILNRCGHWASVERATEVNSALVEFLIRDVP
jgi:pimeloyl-ACP methyl ester carboxylesterase